MVKTFKNLQVGDKIYIGFYAEFVQYIKYVEGYLCIHYFPERKKPKYAYSNVLFIPLNHINANNVKIGNRHVFVSESKYKKYITDFMNSQLKK
jgi:hypothetical protein